VEPPLAKKHRHHGDDASLAGWNGSFYIRDPHDWVRLYPKARVHIDYNGFFGPGVTDIKAADGGNALKSRFFVRRAELEMAGEILKRWSFNMGGEIGSQTIGNPNGKTENAAGPAGADPTAESARFAAVQTPGATVSLADNWVNYSALPFLNFMFGQYQAPFGIENRTGNSFTPFMERNLAIRGFVFPNSKETGLTIWGETKNKVFNYEIGVFGGDGQNRRQVDNRADFMGRVFSRPLATGGKGLLEKAQIGLSARHGERDSQNVGYDYPAITTGNGWALWNPGYTDSFGRVIHVVPSGAQNQIGGELRLPISRVALQGEAYYVANNTREAVDGFQLTNTERLGQIHGVGWYVQLSGWLGDSYITGDPGYARPTKVDLKKPADKPKKGLELLALVGGVNATYEAASRAGTNDEKNTIDDSITTLQYGFGANYWATKHIRVTVNYIIYHTPGSNSADNAAKVPGNTVKVDPMDLGAKESVDSAHLLHELGARIGAQF
jgi:phosphate-selective porin